MKSTCLILFLITISPNILAFSIEKNQLLKQTVKEMFYHGFDNYMKHAFPLDELSPLRCGGKSRDYMNPSNFAVNDVLGDYCLTLVDTMDMLIIMGDVEEFKRAVELVKKFVDFSKHPNTVQLFESNIRMIGGLLSAHLLIKNVFSDAFDTYQYNDDLLRLAKDLGDRLLFAFNSTKTGLPYPRVNLRDGVPASETNETCTAGAGSLLLEFGMLSRLTGNDVYEKAAIRAMDALWSFRSNIDLVGNVVNIQTGDWVEPDTGIGAGIDSFFEYLFKAYVLFGDEKYLRYFEEAYEAIMKYVKDEHGFLYRRVNMRTGAPIATWVDSLGAFFPGLQVLYGDIPNAMKSWEFYFSLWRKYNALPERWDYKRKVVQIPNYPLRPELIESTYMLYQATKDDYYLKAGELFIQDLQKFARKSCGFASIQDVVKKTSEDRMESFFLSETLKYLYLLFDVDNRLNKMDDSFVFTTEAHPLVLPKPLAQRSNALARRCYSWKRNGIEQGSPLKRDDAKTLAQLVGMDNDLLENQLGTCISDHPSFVPETYELDTISLFRPGLGIEQLNDGNYLVTDGEQGLQIVRMTLLTTKEGNIRIHRINSHINVHPKAKVLIKQSYLSNTDIPIQSHFYDNNQPFFIRAFHDFDVGSDYHDFRASPALFGRGIQTVAGKFIGEYPIQGQLVFNKDNSLGCIPYDNQTCLFMHGNIALAIRGQCAFVEKSTNAAKCGAKALIVINTSEEELRMAPLDELGPELDAIVVGLISFSAGRKLLRMLNKNPGTYLDIALFPATWKGPVTLESLVNVGSRSLLAWSGKRIENLILLTNFEHVHLSRIETEIIPKKWIMKPVINTQWNADSDFDNADLTLRIAIITAQTRSSDGLIDDEEIETKNGQLLHLSEEYANLFLQNKKQWANYQGYDHIHTVIEAEDSAVLQVSETMLKQSMHWVKVDLLQKYLNRYDWVCWLDMDTIIVDQTVQLEDYISHALRTRPQADMIVEGSEDYKKRKSGSLRSGVLLLRNSFWTQKILSELKEILADEEWMAIIKQEFQGQSVSTLDDALAYLLMSEKQADAHLYFMTLQDRWNQNFLYMPKIGLLHFTGCTTRNYACLDVFNRAITHLLGRDQMYVYKVAPYVQHLYNIFVVIYLLFALDRLFYILGKFLWPKKILSKSPLPHSTCQEQFPFVVVQLPMFNEQSCCKTIIDCACLLDWPRSRLLIQVVDDSTNDETRQIIEDCIYSWREKGISIDLCRRNNRVGFKAGAMNEAMQKFQGTDVEYIAIFDADFLPQRSFLKATVPSLMANPGYAFVQTMWIYTNAKDSMLTRMQEISLNFHFKCEQEVRFRTGNFFNFNGTAGVWRRSAIESVGGWHTDTLVEDMDLSLRVWAAGWKFIYLDSVKVLNEIPPTFDAYRGQQHRWTSGPMQVLKKAFSTIFHSQNISYADKLFCIWFFLRNYVHIINFLYFLVLIPSMIWVPRVTLYEWAVIYLPAAISISNIIFTPSETARVLHYVLFENAMCLYKTGALICGVLNIGKAKQWIVTPKFARKAALHQEEKEESKVENEVLPDISPLTPSQVFSQSVSKFSHPVALLDSDLPDLLSSSPSPTMDFELSSIQMPPLYLADSILPVENKMKKLQQFPYYRLLTLSKNYVSLFPSFRLHRNELLMSIFLLLCSYFGIHMRQYGISAFCFLNSVAYFALGLSWIGR